eukprot:372186_1
MAVVHVYYDLTEWECDTNSPLDGEFDSKTKSFRALVQCDALDTALVKFLNTQYGNNIGEVPADIPPTPGADLSHNNETVQSQSRSPKIGLLMDDNYAPE